MRLVALALLAACTKAPAPRPPTPPPAGPVAFTLAPVAEDPVFVPPPITRHVLPNGIVVILVENHRIPIVSIATLHTAAGGREDGARRGLAALTADALDEGDAMAALIEASGARVEVNIATDYASVHATSAAERLAPTLALLGEIVRRPKFVARDVARIQATRLAELAQRPDRPRVLAALAFDRIVFGASHPYAYPPEGEPRTVAALDTEDVREFHRTAYTPTTTTIVLAGDVTSAAVAAVSAGFGDWAVEDPHATLPALPPATPPQLAYLDRPGASECAIVLGKRANAAGGDRMAGEVATTILGGGQGSRLDRKLRGELGLTTAVGASYWRGRLGASWSIALATKCVDAVRAIRAVHEELAALHAVDPTDAELARAKALLGRAMPTLFETSIGTVRAIERLVAQERPLESYAAFRDRIDTVTATGARAASPVASELSIVVVGDWAVVGGELAKLGLPVTKL